MSMHIGILYRRVFERKIEWKYNVEQVRENRDNDGALIGDNMEKMRQRCME